MPETGRCAGAGLGGGGANGPQPRNGRGEHGRDYARLGLLLCVAFGSPFSGDDTSQRSVQDPSRSGPFAPQTPTKSKISSPNTLGTFHSSELLGALAATIMPFLSLLLCPPGELKSPVVPFNQVVLCPLICPAAGEHPLVYIPDLPCCSQIRVHQLLSHSCEHRKSKSPHSPRLLLPLVGGGAGAGVLFPFYSDRGL